jgi:DnaJ-class molecular chaperone
VSDESQPDAAQCLACRGTGRVISGLGGTPHEVRCPWCEGTGVRIADVDAQAHPAEGVSAPASGTETRSA